MYEYVSFDGSNEGEYIYYNLDEEPVLKIVYENNIPVQYYTLNNEGTFGNAVDIINETAEIVSKYPNGNNAIELKIVQGNFDGVLLVKGKTGNKQYEVNYQKGILEGNRIEYYSNGKIYKKENFKNSDFSGEQIYYDAEGKVWVAVNYEFNEIHGDFLIYKNGNLITTKKYNSGELVEIIK